MAFDYFITVAKGLWPCGLNMFLVTYKAINKRAQNQQEA